MNKIIFFLFLFIILTNCSIDTKTGIWENKNDTKNDIKLTDLKFNHELSFEDFKKNIIIYGESSKFPKLMED